MLFPSRPTSLLHSPGSLSVFFLVHTLVPPPPHSYSFLFIAVVTCSFSLLHIFSILINDYIFSKRQNVARSKAKGGELRVETRGGDPIGTFEDLQNFKNVTTFVNCVTVT